jgi:hypothetical protein
LFKAVKSQAGKPEPPRNPGSISTDLSQLTESSRFLAHSIEDLLTEEQLANVSFETDTSSKQTPKYEDDDQLDLRSFRKTQDFGDFQILTDSPNKPQIPDSRSKQFRQKLNF